MMKAIMVIALFFLPFFRCWTQGIEIVSQDDGLLATENGEKVLFYQKSPNSHKGEYQRCHYIHPLWGMNGEVLTEDFPDDHLHHRGVFWAWHQIWINGRRIGDPWLLEGFSQEVLKAESESLSGGRVRLETRVLWNSPAWKNGEEPYLEENTQIVVHPRTENFRRIDFQISLGALVRELSIGGADNEKGYGGFSVRMILPDDVSFSGPDGAVKPLSTPVPSRGYVNISGTFEQGPGGIVILEHSDNPRFPGDWILRKKGSMQNAVFPGRNPVQLSLSQPLILQYTLLIYSGTVESHEIMEVFPSLMGK